MNLLTQRRFAEFALRIVTKADDMLRFFDRVIVRIRSKVGRLHDVIREWRRSIDLQVDDIWKPIALAQPRLWGLVGGEVYSDRAGAEKAVRDRFPQYMRQYTLHGVTRFFDGKRCVAEMLPDEEDRMEEVKGQEWEDDVPVKMRPVPTWRLRHRVFFAKP